MRFRRLPGPPSRFDNRSCREGILAPRGAWTQARFARELSNPSNGLERAMVRSAPLRWRLCSVARARRVERPPRSLLAPVRGGRVVLWVASASSFSWADSSASGFSAEASFTPPPRGPGTRPRAPCWRARSSHTPAETVRPTACGFTIATKSRDKTTSRLGTASFRDRARAEPPNRERWMRCPRGRWFRAGSILMIRKKR